MKHFNKQPVPKHVPNVLRAVLKREDVSEFWVSEYCQVGDILEDYSELPRISQELGVEVSSLDYIYLVAQRMSPNAKRSA